MSLVGRFKSNKKKSRLHGILRKKRAKKQASSYKRRGRTRSIVITGIESDDTKPKN